MVSLTVVEVVELLEKANELQAQGDFNQALLYFIQIISNTTISRPHPVSEHPVAKEVGGLSGKPLYTLSTDILKDMYALTKATRKRNTRTIDVGQSSTQPGRTSSQPRQASSQAAQSATQPWPYESAFYGTQSMICVVRQNIGFVFGLIL